MKKKTIFKTIISFLMVLCLGIFITSCGEGGSTSTPTPVNSDPIPDTTVISTKLQTPVVSVDSTGLVSWPAIQNKRGYLVDVDGNQYSYSTPITLTNGQTIKVKAIGDGTTYTDSDWSAPVTYTASTTPVTPATKLVTPVVSVDETGLVSFANVSNASGYKIDVNGTVSDYSRQITLLDGETVKVKAIGDGTNYSDSDWSTPVTYRASTTPVTPATKLAMPNPSFDNNTRGLLTWPAVSGAISYNVYWYSTAWSADLIEEYRGTMFMCNNNVTSNSCYISDSYYTDMWRFTVQAVGDGTNYSNSDWSEGIKFSFSTPVVINDVPVVTFANDTGLATWDAITGATSYTVAVYDLSNTYIKSVDVSADDRTYQMENDTYIRVYVNKWQGTPSEELYYIIKTATLPTPKIKNLSYTANGWVVSSIEYEDGLPGKIEIKINNNEWQEWPEYTLDDEKEYLHQDDIVYVRYLAKRISAYNDSGISQIVVCEHKNDVRYYPYVLPTEEKGGHMAFYKCQECGAILNMSEEDYIYLTDYYHEEIEAEEMAIVFMSYLNWDTYMEALSDWFNNELNMGLATYMGGKEKLLKALDILMNPLEHQEIHEWLYDDTGHFEIIYCPNCGEYEISDQVEAHTFENGVCTICGYKEETYLPTKYYVVSGLNGDGYNFTISVHYDDSEYDKLPYNENTVYENKLQDDFFIVIPQNRTMLLLDSFEDSYNDVKRDGSGGYNEHQYYYSEVKSIFDVGNKHQYIQAVIVSRNGIVKYVNPTGTDAPDNVPYIRAIYINDNQEIEVGQTAKIEYTLDCSDFYWFVSHKLKWSSSDDTILSIDDAGNMMAHKAGTVKVSVEIPYEYTNLSMPSLMWGILQNDTEILNNMKVTVDITVKEDILPTAISTRDDVTITNKNPYQIEITFEPSTCTDVLTYESSNDNIITVDENGLVKAIAEGEADVTVRTSNDISLTIHFKSEFYDLIEKTHLEYDYTDYFDNTIYGNNTPLQGDLNLLVLPIKFADSCPYYDYDLIKHDIEVAFFGTKEFNGTDTVKSYYETESQGKLTINGVVGDWYQAGKVQYLTNDFNSYWPNYTIRDLAIYAIAQYKEQNTIDGVQPSLKEYDNDGDGYLDGVILIYAYPNRDTILKRGLVDYGLCYNESLWAEVHHYSTALGANVDNPVLSNTLMFASFDFMYGTEYSTTGKDGNTWTDKVRSDDCFYLDNHPIYEYHDDDINYYDNITYDNPYDNPEFYLQALGYSGDIHQYVDTKYYIHEMAHMFGIFDYYDIGVHDSNSLIILNDLDGGFDMQHWDVGAHDPYSKIAMSWVDPYIITDNCTIEINPAELTGDVILVPIAGHNINSPFNEYLLIELFTPDALNEFYTLYTNALNHKIGPYAVGCRVWHVDSRLIDITGSLIADGVIDGTKTVTHATSNTFSEDGLEKLYQLLLIRKNAAEDEDAYYVLHQLEAIKNQIEERQYQIDNYDEQIATETQMSKEQLEADFRQLQTSLSDLRTNLANNRPENVYESFLTEENLFTTGDTFDMTRYAKAFYNDGLMNSGEELGWSFTFDYVDSERAIITFTKTE